jgi:hypothetical protein
MHNDRLQEIKSRIEGYDTAPPYFADDYAVALRETGQDALDLIEEVERLRGIEERAKALYAVKDQEAKAASARMEEAMFSDDIGTGSTYSHARAAARWYGQRKELEVILDL